MFADVCVGWYHETLDHGAGRRAVRHNRTEQAKVGSNKETGLFTNKNNVGQEAKHKLL